MSTNICKQQAKLQKKFVEQTAVSAKETYSHLKSKPSQFNCENCNSLLAVPAIPAWKCSISECGLVNDGSVEMCGKCGQPRVAEEVKVMCGVCNKVTRVPSNNLINKFKAGVKEMDRSATKTYYDLSGTDYVVCPRCATPIKLIKLPNSDSLPSSQPSPQLSSQPSPQLSSQPVPSPQTQQTVKLSESGGQDVNCEKCGEKLVLVKSTKSPPSS